MKRILAALLAAALATSMSVVGFADSTTVNNAGDLIAAVAVEGNNITLGADITVSSPLEVSGSNVTINGAGFSIKVENPTTFQRDTSGNGSVITITADGVTLNGVTVDGGGTPTGNQGRKYGIQVYGSGVTATLTDVTVKNCGGWGAILVNQAGADVTGTLTLANNRYGIEVSKGGSLDLSDTTLDIARQGDTIIWVDEKSSEGEETIDVGDTGLPLYTDSKGNVATTTDAFADKDGAYLTVSGLPSVAAVGDVVEFSVTTKGEHKADNGAGSAINVKGTGTFTKDGKTVAAEDATLEYYETANDEGWKPFVGDSFGPSAEFPYTEDVTSEFRITFHSVGEYAFNIQIVEAAGAKLVCSSAGTITVTEEGEVITSDDDAAPAATENDANTSESLSAIRAGEAVEVELRNSAPAIALDTMNLLGANEDASIVASIGDMTVAIPGGFGRVTEAGRIYYPLGFRSPSRQEDSMAELAGDVEYETVEAGAPMTMPTTVTVTLETDLEGTVHVYLYDEDADRVTYIASPVEEDGKVTFTTTRLGHFLLTSEKI